MRGWLAIAVAALGGCAGEPADDSGFCSDVPIVTYETFGKGFMTQNCQTCHASTQTDREGATEGVYFDTVDDVWAHKSSVLSRAASDEPDMPPLGGTTEDDRYLLKVWLTCGVEGQ